MKKILIIFIVSLFWSNNANAGKGDVCAAMEPYKLYLFANYDKTAVTKTLFDKNLDNDAAFEELSNLLN